jgi:hypothetical protein
MRTIYQIDDFAVEDVQEGRCHKYFVVNGGERISPAYQNHTSCILKAQQLHKQARGISGSVEPTNVSFF